MFIVDTVIAENPPHGMWQGNKIWNNPVDNIKKSATIYIGQSQELPLWLRQQEPVKIRRLEPACDTCFGYSEDANQAFKGGDAAAKSSSRRFM